MQGSAPILTVKTPRTLRVSLWDAYEYIAMALGLGALAALCVAAVPLFILLIGLPRSLQQRIARALIRFGLRIYLTFLRVCCQVHIDTSGLVLTPQASSLIVIANHPSVLDAIILMAHLPNACCVLKASLLLHPLFGIPARLAGFVSNAEPRQMIQDSCATLREGATFILFPEGTRTTDFPLNPLGSACVILSKQSQVPLQTVLLEFSSPYLGKHWGWLRPPCLPLHIRVRTGRMLTPPAYTGAAIQELEGYFRRELGERANAYRIGPDRD